VNPPCGGVAYVAVEGGPVAPRVPIVVNVNDPEDLPVEEPGGDPEDLPVEEPGGDPEDLPVEEPGEDTEDPPVEEPGEDSEDPLSLRRKYHTATPLTTNTIKINKPILASI
jgi:hypothetical protein